jgi:hypothetical protein
LKSQESRIAYFIDKEENSHANLGISNQGPGRNLSQSIKILTSPLLIGYSMKSFGYSLNFLLEIENFIKNWSDISVKSFISIGYFQFQLAHL